MGDDCAGSNTKTKKTLVKKRSYILVILLIIS